MNKPQTNKSIILLFGGSGMVGRNIVYHQNYKDYIFYNPTTKDCDLTNQHETLNYIRFVNPDLIIHAAGKVGGIQANINSPFDFLYLNTIIGYNVVSSAKTIGIKKLLNLGSSCMYPKFAKNPLKETSLMSGICEPTNEGYAVAKLSVAKLCEYVSKKNSDLKYKTLIPCNLYGKYDKFDSINAHLIPAIIQKMSFAEKNQLDIDIWGDGTARREFMYAEDLADFIYFAIKDFDKLPSIMNVGCGYDYSINDYYSFVNQLIPFKGKYKFDLAKPTGQQQKLIDTSEQIKLGWYPKTQMQDGILKTYDYYINKVLKNE